MKRLLFPLLALLSGCAKTPQEGDLSLGQTEFGLNDDLSCLTTDKNGQVWLGTENGDILLFDPSIPGVKQRYDLRGSRIYKILLSQASEGDTMLIVGMRNAGIQLWSLKDSLHRIRTFRIPPRGEWYSPYDIAVKGSRIWAATSNGLYAADLSSSEPTMQALYPDSTSLEKRHGEYKINNLAFSPDGASLLFPSPEGLKKLGISTGSTETYLPDKTVCHVHSTVDTVYALAGSDLYAFPWLSADSPGAPRIHTVRNDPQVFYVDPLHNGWLLAPGSVAVSGNSAVPFSDVMSGREIPLGGHQVIASDTGNREKYIYFITSRSLWRIPADLNTSGPQPSVKAACTDGGDLYFLTSRNVLYRKKDGETSPERLCRIDIDRQIEWLAAYGDYLYLHTRENVYRMKIPWINAGEKRPRKINRAPFRDGITACCIVGDTEDPYLYVGTRQKLTALHKGEQTTVHTPVYITSLYFNPLNPQSPVYATTINRGAYRYERKIGQQGVYTSVESIPGLDAHFGTNILEMSGNVSYAPYLLTNQHILSKKSGIRAKGHKKLIRGDDTTFFSIAPKGLQKYHVRETGSIQKDSLFYDGIRFYPQASFSVGDSLLVLGTDMGVLLARTDDPRQAHWLDFSRKDKHSPIPFAMPAGILFILLLTGIYLFYRRKGNPSQNTLLAERLSALRRRIEDLGTIAASLGAKNIRTQIAEAGKELSLPNDKYTPTQTDALSRKVYDLNFSVFNRIKSELDGQANILSRISGQEASGMATRAADMLHRNDPREMLEAVKQNKKWIERYDHLQTEAEELQDRYRQCHEIEGLNKGLSMELDSLLKEWPGDSLQKSTRQFELIKHRIAGIESPQGLEKVRQYIADFFALKKGIPYYGPICARMESIAGDKSLPSVPDKLRAIGVLDRDTALYGTLENIQKCYTSLYDTLEERRPLRDSEEKTVREIGGHIRRFYDLLEGKNREILSGICPISPGGLSLENKILVALLTDRQMSNATLSVILRNERDLRPEKSRLLKKIRLFLDSTPPEEGTDYTIVLLLRSLAGKNTQDDDNESRYK